MEIRWMKLITQRLCCQARATAQGPSGEASKWMVSAPVGTSATGGGMRRSARIFKNQHRRGRTCGYRHVVELFTRSEHEKGSGRVNKKTAKRVAGGMPPFLSKFPPTSPFSVGPGEGESVESNANNRPEQRGPGRAVGQGHQWLRWLMMIGVVGGWAREEKRKNWDGRREAQGHGGRVRTVKTGISRYFGGVALERGILYTRNLIFFLGPSTC